MSDATAQAIGGLLSTASSTYSSVENNNFARSQQNVLKAQQAAEAAQYAKYAATTPAQDMAGITAMKQQMSTAMRDTIIRQITEQMAQSGLSGSPGIVQEAIAEALAKAEVPLWQAASDNYYKSKQLPLSARPTTPIAATGTKSPSTGAAGEAGAFGSVIQNALKLFQPSTPALPAATGSVADTFSSTLPLLPDATSTVPDAWAA